MAKIHTKEEIEAMPVCSLEDLFAYYETNYSTLVHNAYTYGRDCTSDAEDIVQIAFETMIRDVERGKLKGEVGLQAGWIKAIQSKGQTYHGVNQRWNRNIQAGMDAGHEVSLTASPQAHLVHKEDTKALSEVVPAMIAKDSNERRQEILTYVYLKGFKQREAADAAGVSSKYVEKVVAAFKKRVTMIA